MAGFYLSEAPSACLGCSSNFVVSESGQQQSAKLLQNMSPTGMGLLEYQAMPSLCDVPHEPQEGWLGTFTIEQQLEIPSARNWAAPVRATGMVQKHTCQITLLQPARHGPPCWASPL